LFEADSILEIEADSLTFRTPLGKIVKGLGGITPDVFVPLDTSGMSSLMSDLSWSGALRDAAFSFVDAHREDWFRKGEEAVQPNFWREEGWSHLMEVARANAFEIPDLQPEERE
jgi:carboxyl-terminal processing protease